LAKKDQILQESLRLFTENGIQATPMSLIVAKSGVATGTIYHHFKSKQEIIEALYLNFKKELGRVFEQAFSRVDPFHKQFEKIWEGVFHFYINHPLQFRFSQQVVHANYISANLQEEGLKHYKHFYTFFENGIKEGSLNEIDLEVALELVHATIVSLTNLHLSGKVKKLEERKKEAMRFAWQGLTYKSKVKSK
jgi:AcrR family transcriptional regulator